MNNDDISDALIIDYINRFSINDVDGIMQLFDFKKKYQFLTTPGIDQYNMPFYSLQIESPNTTTPQNIASYPVYQGFDNPRINGYPLTFSTQRSEFYGIWPNYVQSLPQVSTGDGGASYTIDMSFSPCIPGHVDYMGIIAAGEVNDPIRRNDFSLEVPVTSVASGVYFTATDENGFNVTVADSGQFLLTSGDSDLYGLLMAPGQAPYGNQPLGGGINGTYSILENTINYNTGVANVTFPSNIPAGTPIQGQAYFIQLGMPRAMLYYNNTMTFRAPPATQYLVELDGYMTPAAFLTSSEALPFGYMAEYLARGAARKILADTGDDEQLIRNEKFFKEQQALVWKRSQRQVTATRTQTIYSMGHGNGNNNQYGGNY